MTFPFSIERMSGETVLVRLKQMQQDGEGFPVVLGDSDSLERMQENLEDIDDDPADLIDAALGISMPEWFAARMEENELEYPSADWPEGDAGATEISVHCDTLTGEPIPEVLIARIPAAEPWQIPCLLKIGGWNECPYADVHAAVFKYWHELYGAVPVCITNDVIEMQVARPPATREAALKLAKEQYAYCPDIVDQGTESVEALAAILLNSAVWYFWWD